jgi:alkylation response protein AidB-like acyl-CoA dehydrogenase
MDFEFSPEQDMLREQAVAFLADRCPRSVVRRVLEDPAEPFARDLWREMAKLGWQSTLVPERHGGLGLTHLELCVLAEELGRAIAPVPFSSSVYLATQALLLAGSPAQCERWLPRLASGEAIGTFALAGAAGRPTPATLGAGVRGGRLHGSKLVVPDGDVADFCVVVAVADAGDGASWQLVDLRSGGVARQPVATLDGSRSHANLGFDGADCERLGADGEGWALTRALLDRAAVLFAWEQVGGAQAALEMARGYALGRIAFGRPIGSFQAIKHKLAQAYVRNTLARGNCYYGAWALDAGAPDLPVAAAAARVAATQAYHYASKENIQTHGGMGFTWESDCQLHYRRAKLLSVNLGSEASWQDRLVGAIERQRAA